MVRGDDGQPIESCAKSCVICGYETEQKKDASCMSCGRPAHVKCCYGLNIAPTRFVCRFVVRHLGLNGLEMYNSKRKKTLFGSQKCLICGEVNTSEVTRCEVGLIMGLITDVLRHWR